MSQHDLVSAQTSNVCITHHAAIACMCQIICNVTSSIVLRRLVQCEQKRWDRDRWVDMYTQRVETAGLCVGLPIKLPYPFFVTPPFWSGGHWTCCTYTVLQPPAVTDATVCILTKVLYF